MRTMQRMFVAVVVLLAASAHAAAPPLLPLQGVLTDQDGVPINGTAVSVRFGLYTQETGGTELWNETQTVTPMEGLFAAYLGQVNTLNLQTFKDNGEVWLEAKVGTDDPMARLRLGSTPFAGYAEYCGNVPHTFSDLTGSLPQSALPGGVVVGAQSCSGGQSVRGVSSTGQVVCAPDTLAALTCTSQQIPKWNGSTWGCAGDEIGAGGTGDITDVIAGDGLEGGATVGAATLSLKTCAQGEILMRGSSAWQCSSDYRAGTWVPAWSDVTGRPTFATVATSGSYADLTNRPDLTGVVKGPQSCAGGTKASSIDSSGAVQCTADADTLAGLGCATQGQIAVRGASAWVCSTDYRAGTWLPAWSDVTGKPTFATVATSGQYADLQGTPTLAAVATTGSYTDLANRPTLATVATTGQYGDLLGRPTLATVATSGLYTDLTGRPALATVATSGSYTDLTNTPSLSGFVQGSGTASHLAKFTAAQGVGDSSVFDDGAGNVGIGTTGPSYRLDVNLGASDVNLTGYGANNNGIRFTNTDAGTRTWAVWALGNSGYWAAPKSLAIVDVTNTKARLVIDPTGNVGIGVPNPSAELDVAPGADTITTVRVRPHSATQSANLQEWLDAAGALLAAITPAGVFTGTAANANALGGVPASGFQRFNPMQTAQLRWYEANTAGNSFAVGTNPWGVAFDGANIWVTNYNSGNVSKLRASDGFDLGTFVVGTNPYGVAFDGANIWVANEGAGTVTKLRASDGTPAPGSPFTVGTTPVGVAFDGANIWVTNYNSGSVSKLRASDGFDLGTFVVGTNPWGVAFDGANIWVINYGSNSVSKLLAATGVVVGTYPTGNTPRGVAFDGANIWVANQGAGNVTKLRASDGFNLGTFTVGVSPFGVAFDGANIWVANWGSNTVTKLRASDGFNLGTFTVGAAPFSVAFDGANIWVSNFGSNTVSKL